MVRCPWCRARNYAIDIWCARCGHHMDWPPPTPARRGRALALLGPVSAALGILLALVVAMPSAIRYTSIGHVAPARLPTTTWNSARALPSNSPAASTPAAAVVRVGPTAGVANQNLGPQLAVARFYEAVAAHDFVGAAALWTPAMRANYPPATYIDDRFAGTKQINLRTDRVVSASGGVAAVYVDLVEHTAAGVQHWVGTWQLVQTPAGWLLDKPDLKAA